MHSYTCTFGYITKASMVVHNTFSRMLLEQEFQCHAKNGEGPCCSIILHLENLLM